MNSRKCQILEKLLKYKNVIKKHLNNINVKWFL